MKTKYVKLFEDFVTALNEKAVTIDAELQKELLDWFVNNKKLRDCYDGGDALYRAGTDFYFDDIKKIIKKYYPNLTIDSDYSMVERGYYDYTKMTIVINVKLCQDSTNTYEEFYNEYLKVLIHELTHYIHSNVQKNMRLFPRKQKTYEVSDLKQGQLQAISDYIFTTTEILAYATTFAYSYKQKYKEGAIKQIQQNGLCGNDIEDKALGYYCQLAEERYGKKGGVKFIQKLTKNVVSLLQGNEYEYKEYITPLLKNCYVFGKVVNKDGNIDIIGDVIITRNIYANMVATDDVSDISQIIKNYINSVSGNVYLYNVIFSSFLGMPNTIGGDLNMNVIPNNNISAEHFPQNIGGNIRLGEDFLKYISLEEFKQKYVPKSFKGKIIEMI